MEKIVGEQWSNPYWGLPYQSREEKREWIRQNYTAYEAARRWDADVTARVPNFGRLFTRSAPGHWVGNPAYPRKRNPVLSIKSFAHDRVVLSAFLEAPPMKGKPVSYQTLCRGLEGRRSLELPRETRRALKIGGRWRNLPLETGFTANARNWVRDVAHICEHAQEGSGIFATLTFPGGTDEGFRVLSIASGYAVDRLNRWLRYKVSGGVFAYVWELQKRGAPHLHYVFRVPSGVNPSFFNFQLRQQWIKILWDISEQSGCDLFARRYGGTHKFDRRHIQVKSKPLNGTYARYISKYMSKTVTKGGGKTKWFPGRWWGVSYDGRKAARALRLESVLNIESEALGLAVIPQLVAVLDPCTISHKYFARIPNGPIDSCSLQLGTGGGGVVHKAICEYILFGDASALNALCSENTTVSQSATLERRKLDEYGKNNRKEPANVEFISLNQAGTKGDTRLQRQYLGRDGNRVS